MLSRRGVRIKILQLLYRYDRDSVLKTKDAAKYYKEDIDATYHMFLYNVYTLIQITKQTLKDSKNRKNKHIITDFDKVFTPKIFTNSLVQSMVQNRELNDIFDKMNFKEYLDADFYGKVYKTYSKEDIFKEYILDPKGDDVTQLLDLFRFCRQDEYFNEKMNDYFARWNEDKSMVVGAVKKYFKHLENESDDFFNTLYPDDLTINEYGKELLIKVFEHYDEHEKLIHPVLENWDAKRLAIIDTIIIHMALTEFLFFETIPLKVTLNEYVELAKKYSTPKSKEFINGVLDKLMKKLQSEDLIIKKGRGKIE